MLTEERETELREKVRISTRMLQNAIEMPDIGIDVCFISDISVFFETVDNYATVQKALSKLVAGGYLYTLSSYYMASNGVLAIVYNITLPRKKTTLLRPKQEKLDLVLFCHKAPAALEKLSNGSCHIERQSPNKISEEIVVCDL